MSIKTVDMPVAIESESKIPSPIEMVQLRRETTEETANKQFEVEIKNLSAITRLASIGTVHYMSDWSDYGNECNGDDPSVDPNMPPD